MRSGCRIGAGALSGVTASVLLACSAQPARIPPAVAPEQLTWSRSDSPAWPTADWYRGFGSAELDQLIDRALRENLDLKAATDRVIQADARARQAHASILPSVEVNPSINYLAGHSSNGSLQETDWAALLSASYELDFWGKNRAKASAATYLGVAARADRQTLRLTTAAGVASTYFEILSARERLVIAHANADAARQVLEAVRSRFAAGYASPVDVATQSGTVAGLEAAIPELEQSLTRSLGALAVLVGEVPERFEIAGQSLEMLQEPAVAPGLPAELLWRRPDVELAEANLAAAHADLQAARAALFPSLTLTAAGGVANPAVNAAVNALAGVGPSLNLGAALVQAVFGGGRLRAQRDEARGREEELLAGYRASILAALMDTENALAARARLDAAREPQQQQLLQSELALAGARSRYDKGYTDFLGVLEAQRAVFAARDQLEQYRLARLRAIVSLCKALGGGWQAEPLPSDGIAHVAQGPATP